MPHTPHSQTNCAALTFSWFLDYKYTTETRGYIVGLDGGQFKGTTEAVTWDAVSIYNK